MNRALEKTIRETAEAVKELTARVAALEAAAKRGPGRPPKDQSSVESRAA